jgi:hypothetical protein
MARGSRGPVLRPGRRFALVGLRGGQVGGATMSVRARRAGRAWGPWLPLIVSGHGPDHRASTRSTEPVWTGPADELQLRGTLRGGCELILIADERPRPTGRRRARAAVAGVPPIIPRSVWGGDTVPPKSSPSVGSVQLAFVHHTVNANTYGESEAAAIVLAIAKYHKNGNGWNDIGYNFLVDRFGRIYEGRAGGIERAIIGAQAGGWNSVSTGVAIIGTFDTGAPPPAALESVARLLAWKLPLHGAPVIGNITLRSSGGSANRYRAGAQVTLQRISGHRDGCSTDCPGNSLYGQLDPLRERAFTIAGFAGAPPQPGPTVTVNEPPASVDYGSLLTVSGLARSGDGQPLGRVGVSIQKQGTKGWVTVGRAITDASGGYTGAVAWRRGGALRAAFTSDMGLSASSSYSIGCTPLLSGTLKAKRVKVGRRAVVSGRVKPRGTVKVLVELKGRDGRYRRVDIVSAKTSASGAYRAVIPLRKAGLYRLTASRGAQSGLNAVFTAPLFVRATRR